MALQPQTCDPVSAETAHVAPAAFPTFQRLAGVGATMRQALKGLAVVAPDW
jgi:hypothetical protein